MPVGQDCGDGCCYEEGISKVGWARMVSAVPSVPLERVLSLSCSCSIWPARPALKSRNCLRFSSSARFSLIRCCRAEDCEVEADWWRAWDGRLAVRYDMASICLVCTAAAIYVYMCVCECVCERVCALLVPSSVVVIKVSHKTSQVR